jgi:hypothetical protein
MAQTGTAPNIPATPTFATAVSTGMIGMLGSQTAQLNVVNLTTTSSTITVSFPCQLQLEFWDATGKMLKSLAIDNLALGAAGLLQYNLPETTSPRTEIRGLVRSNPVSDTAQGSPPLPAVLPASCNVATTLEVFDTATGVTQSLTGDMHPIQTAGVVPLLTAIP